MLSTCDVYIVWLLYCLIPRMTCDITISALEFLGSFYLVHFLLLIINTSLAIPRNSSVLVLMSPECLYPPVAAQHVDCLITSCQGILGLYWMRLVIKWWSSTWLSFTTVAQYTSFLIISPVVDISPYFVFNYNIFMSCSPNIPKGYTIRITRENLVKFRERNFLWLFPFHFMVSWSIVPRRATGKMQQINQPIT